MCHYCDFAKTALFSEPLVNKYFSRLQEGLKFWLAETPTSFSSVFFGGGTPGLFTSQYEPMFRLLAGWLDDHAEISLEANPNNLSESALQRWHELGFNRLSIGVQSFQEKGLRFLTRDHNAAEAIAGIDRALKYFENVNVDLIYGWPAQNLLTWQKDLETVIATGATHVSLYCLSYEPRTPIGRRILRGIQSAKPDDELCEFYELACELLAAAGFEHEEVSNWALPGYSCRHNWLYWKDSGFVGIGAGAHGYLPDFDGPGLRYAYPRQIQAYLNSVENSVSRLEEGSRNIESWLIEYVSSSLRTRDGIDLKHISDKIQRPFVPTPLLKRAFFEDRCCIKGECLVFSPAEWFRENAWSLEVLNAFRTCS